MYSCLYAPASMEFSTRTTYVAPDGTVTGFANVYALIANGTLAGTLNAQNLNIPRLHPNFVGFTAINGESHSLSLVISIDQE